MIGKALIKQFGFNQFVIRTNLDGVSHADSLHQPQPAGNCINWIFGHIVATRNGLLALLGEQPIWSAEEAKNYVRGTEPIRAAGGAHELEKIRDSFEQSQETIIAALLRMSPEEFAGQPAGGEETIAEKVATLSFHESYHAGQLGIMRRLLGRKGQIQ